MENIRQYLLTIIASAILCGIINGIIGKNGAYGTIVKLVTSIVLILTVISPWTKIQLEYITIYTEGIISDAEQITQSGAEIASSQSKDIIKSKVESYILDKASSMGLNLNIDVTLSDTIPHIPCAVQITGSASPYLKQQMKQIIANDLGISEDDQLWL